MIGRNSQALVQRCLRIRETHTSTQVWVAYGCEGGAPVGDAHYKTISTPRAQSSAARRPGHTDAAGHQRAQKCQLKKVSSLTFFLTFPSLIGNTLFFGEKYVKQTNRNTKEPPPTPTHTLMHTASIYFQAQCFVPYASGVCDWTVWTINFGISST